jgi:hypothetical protein
VAASAFAAAADSWALRQAPKLFTRWDDDLHAAEVRQLEPHCFVVLLQQFPPAAIPQLDRTLTSVGDVGEQHGDKRAVGLASTATSIRSRLLIATLPGASSGVAATDSAIVRGPPSLRRGSVAIERPGTGLTRGQFRGAGCSGGV